MIHRPQICMVQLSMDKQVTWVIYGLRLRDTKEFRYVGYAMKDYTKRLKDHLRDAKNNKKGSRFSWIRKYGPDNIESVILEYGVIGDFSYICYLERYWENSLRELGHRLLNDKPCGYGFPPQVGPNNPMYGRNHTQESIDKIKATRKARGLDDRESSYWLGKTLSNETKEKLRTGRIGKKASEETKRKMSETRRGITASPSARANQSKALMGHIVSDETRQKISRARKENPSPANHVRWHLDRDVSNPTCSFCVGHS